MYYGVMPRGSTEGMMPYKIFSRREHAEHWLRHNSKEGSWKVVEFNRKVMDYVTMRTKEKSRIGKLF